NQVGFTTSPDAARRTRYATDIARFVEAPVFHVNGDEPEAAAYAIELALAYRMEFRRDAFVDLICYRKHGHNELDDPTFTQPVMYTKIGKHVPASRRYAERLVAEGVLDAAALAKIEAEIDATLQAAHAKVKERRPQPVDDAPRGVWSGMTWDAGETGSWDAETAVSAPMLDRIVRNAARRPDGFQ